MKWPEKQEILFSKGKLFGQDCVKFNNLLLPINQDSIRFIEKYFSYMLWVNEENQMVFNFDEYKRFITRQPIISENPYLRDNFNNPDDLPFLALEETEYSVLIDESDMKSISKFIG